MALGIQYVHVVGKAIGELIPRKIQRFLCLIPPLFQGILPDFILAHSGHGASHFTGCFEHRIFIGRLHFLFLFTLHPHISSKGAAVEKRIGHLGHNAEGVAAGGEEAAGKGCQSQHAEDGKLRFHFRPGFPGFSYLRRPGHFRRMHIGPLAEHLRRNGVVQGAVDVRKGRRGQEFFIQRSRHGAGENGNPVQRSCDFRLQFRHLGLRFMKCVGCLVGGKSRKKTGVFIHLKEGEIFLLVLDMGLCHRQLFLQGAEGDVIHGHLRRKGYPGGVEHAPLCFQRIFRSLHFGPVFSKEIGLPGGIQSCIGKVMAVVNGHAWHFFQRRRCHVGNHPFRRLCPYPAGACIHPGHQGCLGHAQCFPGLLQPGLRLR